MTATYHHTNQVDRLTVVGYPDDDPSTGVVLLQDFEGHPSVDAMTALVPWDGDAL